MVGEMIQSKMKDGAIVIRLQARDSSISRSQADVAELFQLTANMKKTEAAKATAAPTNNRLPL